MNIFMGVKIILHYLTMTLELLTISSAIYWKWLYKKFIVKSIIRFQYVLRFTTEIVLIQPLSESLQSPVYWPVWPDRMSERSATSSVKKQEKKIVENLTKRTHFSCLEIERLLRLYRLTVVSGDVTIKLFWYGSSRTPVRVPRWIGWTGNCSGSSSTVALTWPTTFSWTGYSSTSTQIMTGTSPEMNGSLVSISSSKVRYLCVVLVQWRLKVQLMNNWTSASPSTTSMTMDTSGGN